MAAFFSILLLLAVMKPALPAQEAAAPASQGTRLKDLVAIEGVRDNQLLGYGLVVGLAGTGDKRQTVFSAQTLSNVLERMGVSVPPTALQAKNTASVMITANLPPFSQPGTRIDVTVAAIGDATSLQGGLLLLAPLKSAGGQVYAAAQGPVVTGGFLAGRANNNQTVNHPTTGRIPSGAIVEQGPPSAFDGKEFRLQLRRSDFTNASRIAQLINWNFATEGQALARAVHAGMVVVDLPEAYAGKPVEFVARLEALRADFDRVARIVINERTGTIVMGKEIRIAPAAILHGNLTVEVETRFAVSQPAALSGGQTTVVPEVGVGIKEDKARSITLDQRATVEDLVRALLAIGSTPRDIVAILQSLQSAGALEAEIEVI